MKRKLMLLLACLFVGIGLVTAQVTKVTGTVISEEDGLPVVGASILVKGTTVGTVTDMDGKFTLSNVPSSAKTLVVSFIGMKSQEVAIKPNLSISLKPDTETLDEVIVVAYGSQSAKSLTSSISSVKADALKDVPSVSFDQMLQGRAAGVSITSPSAGVGQPPIVNIRGVSTINSGSQPLYVVDGMPIQSGDLASMGNANALADINPADILSMDVLKDAAASALYGSRAANGVILITTKKGKQGKTKVTYDMNYGFSQKTKFLDIMNAQEYVSFKNMAYANRYGADAEKPFATMTDSKGNLVDTNWADLVFKNGISQSHTVSISGANDKTQYYMSANFTENEGIVIGDYYNRLGLKANITTEATSWLKVGLNVNYTRSKTSYTDGARNGSTFASSGFPRSAIILPSNIPAYNEDGSAYFEAGNGIGYGPNKVFSGFFNPLALSELNNGIDTYVNRAIASGFAEITPLKGLSLKSQYGIDYAVTEDKRFWNAMHGDGYTYGGLANAYHANNLVWTWTNTANYSFELDKHHFDILAGMEATQTKYNYWTAQGKGLSDDAFHDYESSYDTYTGGGNIYDKSLISYFGRINYDFNYKYMFSANFRRDGYSPLGAKNRYGNFGGVSVAWRISEESFFNSLKDIANDVKIKASWGQVGNANIGYYPSKSYYVSGYYGNYGSYLMSNIGDENLKWEATQTYDIGLSARLLNIISIDMDYYYSKSSDLILGVPQASSTGIPNSSLTTNAGKMMNQGFEFSISADIINNKKFTWNSSLNMTINKNKVLELTDDILTSDDGGYEFNNKTVEGKSLGQLYVYPTGGIDKETGRRIFYGSNGEKTYYSYPNWYLEDGTVYQGDFTQVLCGNTLPTWYGGWSNSFTYKGFDLNIFFQFSGGNYIYNGTKATASDMRFWNNAKEVITKSWSENNKNATYAKPVYGDNYSNGSAMSISDWVEKGDYLRLKNISLGYTFDTNKWPKKLGISALRIYAQAQNLFVITGYTGLDPEIISNVIEPTLAGGVDKNTLPQARTYTFGLNITF